MGALVVTVFVIVVSACNGEGPAVQDAPIDAPFSTVCAQRIMITEVGITKAKTVDTCTGTNVANSCSGSTTTKEVAVTFVAPTNPPGVYFAKSNGALTLLNATCTAITGCGGPNGIPYGEMDATIEDPTGGCRSFEVWMEGPFQAISGGSGSERVDDGVRLISPAR